MPERRKLITIEVITDDSTGIYQVGELDYGVPILTVDWLEAKPGRRELLAKELRWLADQCVASNPPFQPFDDTP